ncbi:MAG: AI-2E family transporter, partial [Fuerstiella sp.]
MIERAPQHMVVVKQRLSFILDKVAAFNEATDHMADSRNDSSKNPRDEPVSVEVKQPALTSNLSILSGTGNAMSFFMFTGVLLYFLLASGDDLLGNIMPALPNLRSRIQLLGVIENVQDGLGRYLAQVTAINFCLGVAVSIATWLLGMPSPLVWGVMAMTLNFIPIVGACVGVLVIFFVTLVNFEAAYFAFVVAGVYAALTALEGQLITPSILGRSMEMSPILVFLSIAIWGWMWGLIGVFLSVPILIAARLASEQYESLATMATMATVLGGRSEATAKGVPQQIFDEDGAEIIAAA